MWLIYLSTYAHMRSFSVGLSRVRYEIFECLRKLAYVALPIFFDEDSIYAILAVLLLCFITFGVLMQAR